MAALAWAEALTEEAAEGASLTPHTPSCCATSARSEAMFLTVAVGTINQWNRIAGALRFAPPLATTAREHQRG